MPQPRPTGPPSVTDLARAHAPRAARIAVVGMVVVSLLAATGALIRFAQHRISHAPSQPVTPPDVEHPTRAWTGTSRFGPITGVAAFGDTLYAGTGDGLIAYPLPCPTIDRVCLPAWHDPVTDGPLSQPASNGDVVYAGSARGSVYAFPATCDGAYCEPLWRGKAGTGPVSAPGVNDDFVYVASTSLYAFPARCGDSDLECPPAWVGRIPARASLGPPAVGAGLVVVTWHAGRKGGIEAFPAVCVDLCTPVWTASTEGPPTSALVSADTAYVVADGALMAFPLSCRGVCQPSWIGPFLMGLPYAMAAREAPTLDHDRIYVGGTDGRLWVFPSSCSSGTCGSLGNYPLGGEPLLAPVTRNGVVYVISVDGVLTAVGETCSEAGARTDACVDPWSVALHSLVLTGPHPSDDVLYVGDGKGRVHAFAIPRS